MTLLYSSCFFLSSNSEILSAFHVIVILELLTANGLMMNNMQEETHRPFSLYNLKPISIVFSENTCEIVSHSTWNIIATQKVCAESESIEQKWMVSN